MDEENDLNEVEENENENENENDPIKVDVTCYGVPTPLAVMMMVIISLSCAGNVYQALNARQPDTAAIAMAKSNQSVIEFNVSTQKRIAELQVEVIKQCVLSGNIPVFINMNVDCKVPAK